MRRVADVSLLRRVRDWLYTSTGPEPKPDQLVELTRFPMRLNAELAVNDLELHGISAIVFGADAEGWAPHLGAAQGNRVMVAYRDLRRAADILERLESDTT